MKAPLSWLQQFLPLNLPVAEIASRFSDLGIEVEGIERRPFSFSGVVVGKVLRSDRHPNADLLQVAVVSTGKEEFQVVCGGTNCRAGIVVAFAPVGASLTDSDGKVWKIKKSKIRDIESNGMICSELELGFVKEEKGKTILELPAEWPLGADVQSFYDDPVFDISLTPNLGHCLSMLGLSRELGASLGVKATRPSFTLVEGKGKQKLTVVVENRELCPRYALREVRGVSVGPSPQWLVERLEACGLRPINNIVDVTNFVMLELGQPLHAFDAAKIEGGKIVVAPNASYKSLETLDGKVREIPPHALLISDAKKPLAFAGIMGGLSSAVTEGTKDIVLEAAQFAPSSVRKTARLIDCKTDSSYRFDRGIDPNGVIFALNRAAFLIQSIAGGEIAAGTIDTTPVAEKEIVCRLSRLNALLGTTLAQGEAIELLSRLEMSVKGSGDTLHVSVPTYRNDVREEIDLIEEVARVFGYNNIPRHTPRHITSPIADTPLYTFEKEIETALLEMGLQQCITCDLISLQLADLVTEKGLEKEARIAVLHPRSIDQSILRTSLLPGLLEVVKRNHLHQIKDLHLFEIGRIHFKEKEEFIENTCASFILGGKSRPWHWEEKPREFDFFDAKGMVETVLKNSCGAPFAFEPSHLHTLHPWRQARIKVGNATIGVVGEIHPHLAQQVGLAGSLFFSEINLQDLFSYRKKERKSKEILSLPGSHRDWTIPLREEVAIASVLQTIGSAGSHLLEKYELIDLFTGERIGKGLKNATIRFFYRDKEKTLALESVEKEHQRIVALVSDKLQLNG